MFIVNDSWLMLCQEQLQDLQVVSLAVDLQQIDVLDVKSIQECRWGQAFDSNRMCTFGCETSAMLWIQAGPLIGCVWRVHGNGAVTIGDRGFDNMDSFVTCIQ